MKIPGKTLITALVLAAAASWAANTVMVGGMEMYPDKDIVDNAVNSGDHTTLVAAVKAAGLVLSQLGAPPRPLVNPPHAAEQAAAEALHP